MDKNSPLVSIICLSYNHRNFITEALQSVVNQSYTNCELIIVDDASTDGSQEVIEAFVRQHPVVQFISLKENKGNCAAFNRALQVAQGEYIIDLASDDVLLPDRVQTGVNVLLEAGEEYGVTFSDAEYIDAHGAYLHKHSDRFPYHTIPQGDIYKALIRWYFICPPTVMFRKKVIDELKGYDETLSYEDFDFWIRSSRNYKYVYTPNILVRKRELKNSLSSQQFTKRSRHSETTWRVCGKIAAMNQTPAEHKALRLRLLYEIKCSLQRADMRYVFKYMQLLLRNIFK